MMQIGNIHIGMAETTQKPKLNSDESFLLWDFLVSRYDVLQLSQIFQNYIHDPDFKLLLKEGILNILEKEIDALEKKLNTYEMVLPKRPPKSVNLEAEFGVMEDEFMFRQIFTGVQSFLEQHVRTIRSFVSNDPLRDLLNSFLNDELDTFDNLCYYGKTKGWLQNPPVFKA